MENPSSRLMYGAKRLHKVYEVNDNKITSYKIYYTYENSGAASEKFVEAKEKALEDYNVKEVTQNGKYIIVEMKSKTYEGIDPDEIRTMVQKLEQGLHYEPNQEEKTEPTEEDFLIDEEDEEE